MKLFTTLLLAHLIADFPLQIGWVYRWKLRSTVGLAVHIAIHLFITALFVRNPFSWWYLFVLLGVIHFRLDWIKIRKPTTPGFPSFLMDQIGHIVTLILIVLLGPNMQPTIPIQVLPLSLGIAALSAALTFAWVFSYDLSLETTSRPRIVLWTRNHALKISQIAGFLGMVFLGFSTWIY